MGLHLIIGNSGSGKTTECYKRLLEAAKSNPAKKFFLMVPEQYTMQTQRDIVEHSACHGTLNIDIVSFLRLGYRIFEELSLDLATVLEDYGKSMLLRKVLGELNDELQLYRSMKDKTGFIDQVKSVLSEFYQYEIHEEELRALLAETDSDSLLACKLQDLLLIYQGFSKAMGERYQVAEQLLDLLCEVAGESKLLADSIFYFDGYTGFTPVQYRLIARLMELGVDCTFTIAMDERTYAQKDRKQHLFMLGKETYEQLLRCYGNAADDDETNLERVLLFDRPVARYRNQPDLAALEANLYRPYACAYEGEVAHVRLWNAKNMHCEVHAAAADIRRMVDSNGLRYRDIAVVCADEETYTRLAEQIFTQYEIPCFIDHTNRLLNHPYVEALRAVLDIVSRGAKGYTYDRMMRYLNTGLSGVSKEQAGAVDTYLTATNTVGRSLWENGFKRFPKNYWLRGGEDADRERQEKRREGYLSRINQLRAKVMESLLPLQRAFDAQTTVKQKVIALYEYMITHHYEEQLRSRAEALREDGELVMAQTWESIYASIIGILDKLVAILGDEVMANAELSAVLDAGLADLTVGTVPPTLDQVLIGDFMRTRLSDVKVLYVMGLNDTNVPVRHTSPNLLSDRDRLELSSCHGVSLAPDCNTAAYQEQFYLYQMLTKPSEQLVLSYARMDVLSTAMRPSSLLSKVQKILPGLTAEPKEQEVYLTTRATVYPYLVQAAAAWLADAQRGTSGEVNQVVALCVADAQYQKEWERFQSSWLYRTQENALSPKLSLLLYGARLNMSVTRLEQYAGCAFAHFLKYGLHIKEPEKYQFESADFGNVLHRVVELFGRQMKDEGLSYRELTAQAVVERTERCVGQALSEYHYEFAEEGERSRYSMKTIERIAKRTIKMLCRQVALGNFVPSEFELTFGEQRDIDGPTYPVGEGSIALMGTIDRLDVYEDEDGGVYLKVVDYKTGKKQLDLTKVYYGLQVQLLTYLMVARNYYKAGEKTIPAAALYYPIQDPVYEHASTLYGASEEQRTQIIDQVARDTVYQYAMNGIVSDAPSVLDNIEEHAAGAYQFESIPVALNKDGTMAKRSKCNSEAEIVNLLHYVEREIETLGSQMLTGNVEIAPYKYKQESACTYCPYQSVCLVEQNRGACERVLAPKNIEDFAGGEENDTK